MSYDFSKEKNSKVKVDEPVSITMGSWVQTGLSVSDL